MAPTALPDGASFQEFSLVCLNANGRFVEPGQDLDEFTDGAEITPAQLPAFLKRKLYLPDKVTDVFVWVHGWRNSHSGALAQAKRLFNGIVEVRKSKPQAYLRLDPFVPAFVAVRWPSISSPLPSGYRSIRDRAAALTEHGDAEFFLASLLGYLDTKNERVSGPKTLASRRGFFIHCLGHSFGGRFVTAAVRAAGHPQARTLQLVTKLGLVEGKVLGTAPANGFEFTVDSVLIFQMAAPRSSFGKNLKSLVHDAPLRGPVVLTFSRHDRANCLWHRVAEWGEPAIGCSGASEPKNEIGKIPFAAINQTYTPADFGTRIVNVEAGWAFQGNGLLPEGAHSDFYYEESIHLVLSLANFVHG